MISPRPVIAASPYFRPRLTLRSKLILGTSILLGLVAVFLLSYVPAQLSRQALRQMEIGAETLGKVTAYGLSRAVLSDDLEGAEAVVAGAYQDDDLRYMIVEKADGGFLAGRNLGLAMDSRFRTTDPSAPEVVGSLLRSVAPITYEGDVIGQVYLGYSLDGARARVADSRRRIGQAIAGVFLFAFVGVFAITSFLNRPLSRIIAAAEDIADGDLTRRSGVRSDDEIGRFAAAFDTMVDRLQRSQMALHSLNRELEDRVELRTAELNRALADTIRAEEAARRLTEQLQQAQKLEAVGRLAGGVAHDFNNLLTVIGGTVDLLMAGIESTDERWDDLLEIRKASERAAALTQQLLAFSRRQPRKVRALHVGTAIQEMSALLGRLIGADIHLELDIAPELPAVRADPGQIGQVIMNLAVNARDAMEGGGHLKISCATAHLEPEVAAGLEMAAGPAVLITVADSGVGMDEETRSHIFEPFFTTKGVDRGTGLGLATVYGIVKQSGGGIEVESAPGHGTVFRIYLPSSNEEPAVEPLRREEGDGGSHEESILVVEDEPAVRELMVRLLERWGYRVVACATPSDALSAVATDLLGFDAVVSDIVMPEMDGVELARRFLELRPGLPILFLSGFPRDRRDPLGVNETGVDFIQKPVVPQDLAVALRALIDRSRARRIHSVKNW